MIKLYQLNGLRVLIYPLYIYDLICSITINLHCNNVIFVENNILQPQKKQTFQEEWQATSCQRKEVMSCQKLNKQDNICTWKERDRDFTEVVAYRSYGWADILQLWWHYGDCTYKFCPCSSCFFLDLSFPPLWLSPRHPLPSPDMPDWFSCLFFTHIFNLSFGRPLPLPDWKPVLPLQTSLNCLNFPHVAESFCQSPNHQ